MSHDLKIWSMSFDPIQDLGHELVSVSLPVRDYRAGDGRFSMQILLIDLRGRDVKAFVQLGEQRLEPASLLFQRRTTRKMKFDDQANDVHGSSDPLNPRCGAMAGSSQVIRS